LVLLRFLRRIVVAKNSGRQPAKTSPEFATALTNVHAAYVKGDENQIGGAREKLDTLMEKQDLPRS
jgi:hypothetical protein